MSNNIVSFEEADIVFVNDLFVDEYIGGAELSTEALFETSPYKIAKIKSSELKQEMLFSGSPKKWVFFNFTGMDLNLIPTIVANCYYFIVEYDYKFCRYRSIELHENSVGKPCDCHEDQYGKYISAFFQGAEHIFWMSDQQKERYFDRFPFLTKKQQTTLSSIFNVNDLEFIERLRNDRKNKDNNDKYALVESKSWIKGTATTVAWLEKNNYKYDIIKGLPYHDLLRKLCDYKGLIFKPLGGDTCPRLVIEAKLLGLDLIINENVQHCNEPWWSKDINEIESYILDGHNRFWNVIEDFMERKITISGYTQAYNVMNSDYPWKESIISLLGFCDEVVVLDGGSDDGTWEELQSLANLQADGRLVVKQLKRDWNHPRFALFNGQQKAAARTLCTGDWCWQVDIDEVVHENDYEKIKLLVKQLPKTVKIVSLPVVEYWGGTEKVRMDINPWKWRLSKNDPHITHDVNSNHRRYDENGNLFSAGSDGDDYVHTDNYNIIPDMNFYTPQLHEVRQMALGGNKEAHKSYQNFMDKVVVELPGVHHYSWFDLKRKIYSYKNFWSKHWASLYNKTIEDVPENNMFFDKSWSDVSDEEIDDMSIRMKNEMGGWVFHERIDFNKPTPWINITKSHPKIMKNWLNKRKQQ